MGLSNERIQELKEIMEKDSGKEVSLEEATEAAHNLAGLAHLFFDLWVEENRRAQKLRESPKGFVLDGVGYTCAICGHGIGAGENWYDKWGVKCRICQASIDRGEIPAWAAKHKGAWYSKYDLESRFNLKHRFLKNWVAKGILKVRAVTVNDVVHTQIFLIVDNKGFLPPKRLTESQMVREEKDGQNWYHSEPWYKFVDPFEHLKDYRIMEYMRPTEQAR